MSRSTFLSALPSSPNARGYVLRGSLGLVILLATAATVRADMICFCVDCPTGSGIGLPVGIGHGFVQLKPMGGPQAGQTLGYGLYPAGNDIFGGAGIIKNDTTRRSDFCLCFPVTVAQYNAAAALIRAAIAAPPAYNMATNNCVDFVNSVATAAGITLPNTATSIPFDGSVSDPAAMWNSFDAIGVGGGFMGGTLASIGGPVTPGTPNDYSYAGLVNDGHSDPAGVASYTSLALDSQNLGLFNANLGSGIDLNLSNVSLSSSIISIDWGDGSILEQQFTSFNHIYSNPGSYNANLFVMDSGAVHTYDMLINVGGSPSDTIEVLVSQFPPGNVPNPGFEPSIMPLDRVPEPSTLVLALVGLSIGLMGRVGARRGR